MPIDTLELLRSLMKIAHFSPASTVQPVEIARDALVKAVGSWRQAELPSVSTDTAIESWLAVEQLRAPEGAQLTLICDNPDFNGQPNCAVEMVDDWTAWKTQRFAGETVLDCLQMALAARDAHVAIEQAKREPRA